VWIILTIVFQAKRVSPGGTLFAGEWGRGGDVLGFRFEWQLGKCCYLWLEYISISARTF